MWMLCISGTPTCVLFVESLEYTPSGGWANNPCILKAMETREQLHQRIQREQQLKARLRLATTRLADAEQERLWAIMAAHQAGLSIRQIAAATGLSRSRIHQLLQDD